MSVVDDGRCEEGRGAVREVAEDDKKADETRRDERQWATAEEVVGPAEDRHYFSRWAAESVPSLRPLNGRSEPIPRSYVRGANTAP